MFEHVEYVRTFGEHRFQISEHRWTLTIISDLRSEYQICAQKIAHVWDAVRLLSETNIKVRLLNMRTFANFWKCLRLRFRTGPFPVITITFLPQNRASNVSPSGCFYWTNHLGIEWTSNGPNKILVRGNIRKRSFIQSRLCIWKFEKCRFWFIFLDNLIRTYE